MILRALDLLFVDPLAFLVLIPILMGTIGLALVIGITVHEFSHALVAYNLGDVTAKRLGRLSLNPLAHLDPVGTLMLFLVGFGWGKPVPVNPAYLRSGMRKGMSLVAAAGPLSNIATAAVFALPIKLGLLPWHSPFFFTASFRGGLEGILADLLGFIIFYNLILAVFNLIPLSPLDGFKVALGILPQDLARSYARLETLGPALLLLIIFLDFFLGLGIFWRFIRPVSDFLAVLVTGHNLF